MVGRQQASLRILQKLPDLLVKRGGILSYLLVRRRLLLRVHKAVRNLLDDLGEQILGYPQIVPAVGVYERIAFIEQLRNCGSSLWISVQAVPERGLQTRWNPYVADAVVCEVDFVVAVYDGEDARHLVGDVGEGGFAVDHLIQYAAETPDVARFAELHVLRSIAVAQLAPCAASAVFETFGGHIIWGTDVRIAVDVHCMVNFDGVCDAKVDELEAALYQQEVGGLEIGVHYVVFVDGTDTFKHLFPVVAGKAEVKLCVCWVELHADYAGEVRFAEFHEL